jgi:dTDP-4-amino-4,6-dideoxygalactose transaminase
MRVKKAFSKPIFISLSPNVEKDDLLLALRLLFSPWRWKKGEVIDLLEKKFRKYLGVKHAFSFNSGRSSFLAILKALNLKKGDEVLLQAFTCNAATNPILALGLRPVYVDIEKETLNIDPEDLKRKISQKSKVVLVQHTFGLPAKMDEILEICKKYNLILIEDCAHSLGATYNGKKIGTFGKAAFFSFGRDKIISSVYGGIAMTNDSVLAERIKKFWDNCPYPSNFWILQQLLHPILTEYFIKPLYRFFGAGKYFLIFLQKIKILSKGVAKQEKKGRLPKYIPQKMPNSLAALALNQFKKLERFNAHRKRIAEIYDQELQELNLRFPQKQEGRIYMRYSLLLKGRNTDEILKELGKKKIFLDDGWRKTPIVPPDTDQKKMQYQFGTCKNAEFVAKCILNLPTHINISEKEAKLIVKSLKSVKAISD